MNREGITYGALDAHQKLHRVAMQLPCEKEAQEWTIRNTVHEVTRMAKQMQKKAPGEIRMCYEAGPCGFALKRILEKAGVPCMVVAPSLIPTAAGERVKTDRRDARKLLGLLKAGLLTEVVPPSEAEEAVRDLCRCRDAAREDLMRARHRLLKFLSRQARVYTDGSHWTQKHYRWLRGLRFADATNERVFTEYLTEESRQHDRVKALDRELEAVAQWEPYREPVAWLRCFRGIDTLSAMTLSAELYGMRRFDSPRKLMRYLGMTPSEWSSGGRRRLGGITKAGNRRVRRLLIEAAWHCRHRPQSSPALNARRRGQPKWVTDIAERAETRLHHRYQALRRQGKLSKVAVTAVARELIGFLWEILIQHGEGRIATEVA